jgi:hypothetical protein
MSDKTLGDYFQQAQASQATDAQREAAAQQAQAALLQQEQAANAQLLNSIKKDYLPQFESTASQANGYAQKLGFTISISYQTPNELDFVLYALINVSGKSSHVVDVAFRSDSQLQISYCDGSPVERILLSEFTPQYMTDLFGQIITRWMS